MLSSSLSVLLLSDHDESLITDDGLTLLNLKNDVSNARESIFSLAARSLAGGA